MIIHAAMITLMAGGLLSACASPSAPINSPVKTSIPAASPSPTSVPSFTTTPAPPTPTATLPPSVTPTATITPSPTEDLTFYQSSECLPADTGYQRGTVIDVIDGDTIEVQLGEGITSTVRYIGIDAPESGFPFYGAARQANSELVLHKEVVLIEDQSETDVFGRLLRYIVVGKVFLNQELVSQGYARAVNYPPDEACKGVFASSEQAAQARMVGMWAPTQTFEPADGQVIIVAVNKREEWVEIQNVGEFDIDLSGWNLVSERGHQECPLSGIITAGQVLRIWAMTAQGEGFSCGYNSPIWNNSEPDPAVLYNDHGVEVSRK